MKLFIDDTGYVIIENTKSVSKIQQRINTKLVKVRYLQESNSRNFIKIKM